MPIAPCFDPTTGASGGASGGGGTVQPVTAPAPTSQAVAAGGTLSAKTFSAFTDPGGRIDPSKYVATTTTASGSTSWSGSGLGAFTPSGSADGDAGTLSLTARDSSNNPLATAVHSYERASAAGAGWVNSLTIDLTGLSSTTLSAGSQVVDGVTIECQDAGETVGGGAGLSAAATKNVFVDVASAFSGNVENPKLLVMKTTMSSWGGSGTGHAVRARMYSAGISSVGAAPAAQTRFYPSGSAMRLQAQWQHRYPTSTGSFSSSSSFDHAGDSAVTAWYSHIAVIRGTYYVWISKTLDVPTSLEDLLTPDAGTIVAAINAYSVVGTAAYFPATMFAGLYNQSESSLAKLDEIKCYEYR